MYRYGYIDIGITFAIHLKLTQCCKSSVLQLNKNEHMQPNVGDWTLNYSLINVFSGWQGHVKNFFLTWILFTLRVTYIWQRAVPVKGCFGIFFSQLTILCIHYTCENCEIFHLTFFKKALREKNKKLFFFFFFFFFFFLLLVGFLLGKVQRLLWAPRAWGPSFRVGHCTAGPKMLVSLGDIAWLWRLTQRAAEDHSLFC